MLLFFFAKRSQKTISCGSATALWSSIFHFAVGDSIFPFQFVFCLIPTEPPQFPLFISSEKYFTRFKAPDLNKTILFLWRKIEIYFKTKNKLIPSKFLKLLLSFLKITFRLSNKRLFLVRRKQFSMKRENGLFARNDIFKIIHKDSVVFLHSQNIAWVLQIVVHSLSYKSLLVWV